MYPSTVIPEPTSTSDQEPSTSSPLSPSTSQLRTYPRDLISTTSVSGSYLTPAPSTTTLRPISSALVPAASPRSTQFDKGRVFKVIVIGNANVGKTTLTYRFCEGKFLETAEATIGVDFRSRVVNIDGEDITLQLWDTAGQERFRQSMVRHYYKNAHAIVFVYDVTNAESFDGLKRWIQESHEYGLGHLNLPKILIGNKCDGASVVTTNVAQRFADQYDMPLFETSARLDSQCDNVESIFMTLAFKLKNNKGFNQPLSISNRSAESKKVITLATDKDENKDKNKGGCC